MSRTALTSAATGKDGQSAKDLAKKLGDAGAVIAQSSLDTTLLDQTVNLTRQALVEAATGKEGDAAKGDAKRYGAAGDVLKSVNVDTFDPAVNLTRQALVEAATGKDAKAEVNRIGSAGDVLAKVPTLELFNRDTNLTNHLSQIARLPDSCWSDAVAYLLKEVARLSVRA